MLVDPSQSTSTRLTEGVYKGTPDSAIHLIKSLSPFSEQIRKFLDDQRAQESKGQWFLTPEAKKIHDQVFSLPREKGTCDHFEQITAKWPFIKESDRKFVIFVQQVDVLDRPDWRYVQGAYIGSISRPEKFQQYHVVEVN